jgi:hypothetical protein
VFWFNADNTIRRDNVDGLAAVVAPAVKDTVTLDPILDYQAAFVRRTTHRAMPWLVAQMKSDV